jgi:4-hydroxybenzoate polyprenyltransferase
MISTLRTKRTIEGSRTARARRRLATYLDLVQFQHTVFALPFALAGAVLGGGGRPATAALLLAVVAVVGLRTAAMAFNRLADRRFDAANPRTAERALVTGEVSPGAARALLVAGLALFAAACAALGPWPLRLAPLFAALAFGYSFMKRWSAASHFVLGAALALAPFGGWLATAGDPRGYPWMLSLGVALWVAGFDIVYACQDEAVDRATGLHSIPAALGAPRALRLAAALHLGAFLAFVATGALTGLAWPFFAGLAGVAAALFVEHRAVSASDLSRIRFAFFTLNGVVSVTVLAAVVAAFAVAD